MYSWGKDLSTRDPVCALIIYLSFFLMGPTGPWHPHGVAKNDWSFRSPTWQPEGRGDHSGLSVYQRAGMFASLLGVSERTYHYVDDWIIYTSYSKPSCQGFDFVFLSLKFMLRVKAKSYLHTNHKEETQKGALKDSSSFRKAWRDAIEGSRQRMPVPGPVCITEMCKHTDREVHRAWTVCLCPINYK